MAELTLHVSHLPVAQKAALVTLTGAIDAATVLEFTDKLDELQASGLTRFILDLEGVKYVNSTGLGALVKLADGLTGEGGAVCLTKIHPKVKVVFDMLGLNAFFQIFPDNQTAERFLEDQSGTASAAAPPAAAPAPLPAPAPLSKEQPKEFPCQGCGTKLKIAQAGTYKCPKCYLIFAVAADGAVSYPSTRPRESLALTLVCTDGCLEGLLAFAQAIAKQIGFATRAVREIQASIYDAVKTLRAKAYDGDAARTYVVAIVPSDREFQITITDQGRPVDAHANGSYAQSRKYMDHFEHRRGPQGGNVVTMAKKK